MNKSKVVARLLPKKTTPFHGVYFSYAVVECETKQPISLFSLSFLFIRTYLSTTLANNSYNISCPSAFSSSHFSIFQPTQKFTRNYYWHGAFHFCERILSMHCMHCIAIECENQGLRAQLLFFNKKRSIDSFRWANTFIVFFFLFSFFGRFFYLPLYETWKTVALACFCGHDRFDRIYLSKFNGQNIMKNISK